MSHLVNDQHDEYVFEYVWEKLSEKLGRDPTPEEQESEVNKEMEIIGRNQMSSDIGEYIVCDECEERRFIEDHHCPKCDACWSVRDDPEQDLELPVGICDDCKSKINN